MSIRSLKYFQDPAHSRQKGMLRIIDSLPCCWGCCDGCGGPHRLGIWGGCCCCSCRGCGCRGRGCGCCGCCGGCCGCTLLGAGWDCCRASTITGSCGWPPGVDFGRESTTVINGCIPDIPDSVPPGTGAPKIIIIIRLSLTPHTQCWKSHAHKVHLCQILFMFLKMWL